MAQNPQQPMYPQVQPPSPQQPYVAYAPSAPPQSAPIPYVYPFPNQNIYIPKTGYFVPPTQGSAPATTVVTTTTTSSKPKGLFGIANSVAKKLEAEVANVAHELDKSLTKMTPSWVNEKNADERFRIRFRLPASEVLVFEQPCKAATSNDVLAGTLYLCTSYLCFYSEFNSQKCHIFIPLREISMVNKAVISNWPKENQPMIVPINTIGPKDQAFHVIEVYTVGGQVHQFYSFIHCENVMITIDNTVRACNRNYVPPLPEPYPVPQVMPAAHKTVTTQNGTTTVTYTTTATAPPPQPQTYYYPPAQPASPYAYPAQPTAPPQTSPYNPYAVPPQQ
eukprot:CAMPEP_0168558056 /NCGR_PEP_ID=MMETSP0413-20121227/9761_1 /TAXON_ID=136452 /ORGANISM="Filamoeba nolandi, Strain NC-AS-23-1" /LENGTH=334 /DNA_ID=CAMNT_0008589141 /DNA_START=37 /DNA_END=1038 /DNA_ORIENTATION=+